MAEATVVVDNVLCFIVSRFGKSVDKQLKSVVLDFYGVKDICCAKDRLLCAAESFKSVIKLPHIPLRREGEQRAAKSLDDIITILTCLDESLNLKCLPKYVAESPDDMPSMRVYDGDLATLMVTFDKFKDRMSDMEAALAAILKAINTTRDMLMTPSEQCGALPRPIVNQPQPVTNNVRQVNSVDDDRATEIESRTLGNSNHCTALKSAYDWASVAEAVSTPVPLRNRYAGLQIDDDDNECERTDSDANQFIEQRSRRSAKRRRRSDLQQQEQRQQQQPRLSGVKSAKTGADPANTGNVQRPGRGLLTGKMKITSNDHKLMAARKLIKKAVFCVDNVHPSVSENDIRSFVAGLSVQVVSCFAVKPRRRRKETGLTEDRKAFRLCIVAEHRDRLLDDTKWPESVVISEWYHVNFVNRRQATNEPAVDPGSPALEADKRRRVDERPESAVTAGHETTARDAGSRMASAAVEVVIAEVHHSSSSTDIHGVINTDSTKQSDNDETVLFAAMDTSINDGDV